MAKAEKILWRVLTGQSDANIRFADLRTLLLNLGFEERTRGSHNIFSCEGVNELINLQQDGTWPSHTRLGRCAP